MQFGIKKIIDSICNTDGRSLKLLKNIGGSFIIKGWSALIVLMMVPLTLSCLGIYKNGVWLTISSMLMWIDQMDIGLGNGMRNRLAAHVARGELEDARKVVSSTMVMLACIVVPILGVLSVLIWCTDVYTFLNVSESIIPEFRVVLLASVVLVCMTFVMKSVGNVYMGMQLPAVNNFIIALGQTIALVGTWVLYVTGNATFMMVVLVNTAAPLIAYILSYPYTFYVKFRMLRPSWRYVNLRSALELGNLGVKFFWLQTAAVIQFMTANLLISKFFSPAMVTPYQITYRYMSIVIVGFTIFSTPFWNATTDAFERGDMAWIKNADRKMRDLTMITFLVMILMVLVSPWVYMVWIKGKCDVPFMMTVLMALYVFLLVLSMRYSCFLNGVGALKMQLYMTSTVLLFIPLSWCVAHYTHEINWFMAVMCLCIAPSVIVNKIQVGKIIRGTAKGVWMK